MALHLCMFFRISVDELYFVWKSCYKVMCVRVGFFFFPFLWMFWGVDFVVLLILKKNKYALLIDYGLNVIHWSLFYQGVFWGFLCTSDLKITIKEEKCKSMYLVHLVLVVTERVHLCSYVKTCSYKARHS